MKHPRPRALMLVLATAVVVAGCASSGTKLTSPQATETSSGTPGTGTSSVPLVITPDYHPKIDPARFTNKVDNKYFPLKLGMRHVYTGVRDGAPTRHVFTVTHDRKTVMGVKCLVISDVVTQNQSLVEKTTDWYAQDVDGNVWYFGEDTAEYQNGVVVNTQGTWEAGVDNALPGIVMPAVPKVGDSYRQEFRPGVAMDMAKILSLSGNVKVPAGAYTNVVVTFDRNPLDPSKKERKWYAEGVGFVRAVLEGGGHQETTELVK
jgi:hypothetical protein